MVKQSKPELITTTAVIKMTKIKGKEMQSQRQHSDVLSKRKPKNSAKNLSVALQAVNDPLENQLRYMNSNRPSKPNLSYAPKPFKLLAPTGLRRTLSSLAYRIPQ